MGTAHAITLKNTTIQKKYLSPCRIALNQAEPDDTDTQTHQSRAERQAEYTGTDPLRCPNGDQPLTVVGHFFGNWQKRQYLFDTAGKDAYIAPALLKPG
jgi:hypothetical protein